MPRGYKHGLRYTTEYLAWINMRQRCFNQKHSDFHRYGGRGIMICPQWDSPVKFIEDMGLKPSDSHELDRIDNDKGYSKENCRWVKHTPQMRNTRLAKIWYVNNVRYESLSHAAKELNTTINTIKRWCEGRTDGGYTYPPKQNCWSEGRYHA